MGRLDHLVEAVYERYKDRYFRDESAFSLRPTLNNRGADTMSQRSMLTLKETSTDPSTCVSILTDISRL